MKFAYFLIFKSGFSGQDEDHIHSNRYASRVSKEMDYERKVKKRKDKLITATENAFSHLGPSSQGKFNGKFRRVSSMRA